MSDPHADEVIAAGGHGADDHGEAPGHEHDDHAHGPDALGPIDWVAWGAGALGVVIGLAMAAILASIGGGA
jgi:hypothetical protein